MRTLLIILIILLITTGLGTAGAYYAYQQYQKAKNPPVETAQIEVGEQVLTVDLAQTQEQWGRGLSGKTRLSDNEGMLFISSDLRLPGFWMSGMQFDLDIIWIREGEIIAIDEHVPAPKTPEDPLQTYHPPKAIDMVLEVNAGWSERNGVTIGDRVKIVTEKSE